MTLDKIVDAYLALADLREQKGCPIIVIDVVNRNCNIINIVINELENLIEKCSRAEGEIDVARHLTHRGRPMVWCESRCRFIAESQGMIVDTTEVEVNDTRQNH